MRGWSLAPTPEAFRGSVLPAHAGMVPSGWCRRRCTCCAPRACGDGPKPGGGLPAVVGCSPRMRGWSRGRPRIGVREGVLSAHATERFLARARLGTGTTSTHQSAAQASRLSPLQPRVRTERGRSRPPSAGSSGVCASPATRPASRGSTPRRRIRPPRGRAGSTMRSRTRRHASERRGAGRRNRIHSHRYMWCGRCRGRSPPMSRRVREPTARQLGDLHVSHRDRCRAARRAARGSGAGRG